MNRIWYYLFRWYAIFGAGAVVKGEIPDYSVVVGNLCKIINDTRNYGYKIFRRKMEL